MTWWLVFVIVNYFSCWFSKSCTRGSPAGDLCSKTHFTTKQKRRLCSRRSEVTCLISHHVPALVLGSLFHPESEELRQTGKGCCTHRSVHCSPALPVHVLRYRNPSRHCEDRYLFLSTVRVPASDNRITGSRTHHLFTCIHHLLQLGTDSWSKFCEYNSYFLLLLWCNDCRTGKATGRRREEKREKVITQNLNNGMYHLLHSGNASLLFSVDRMFLNWTSFHDAFRNLHGWVMSQLSLSLNSLSSLILLFSFLRLMTCF